MFHILCSKPFSSLVTNVHTLFSGSTDVSLLIALVIIISLVPMLNTLSILCMIVLFTVFPLIPLLLEGWLGGRMVLGCLKRHPTFGVRCGLRLGALRLVCYLVLKRMLNGGTNMLIIVLSTESSILCYRRNWLAPWLAPFPRKLKIISDIKLLHRSSKSSKSHAVPIVDGVSCDDKIANVFALKLGILNTHSSIPRDSLLSSIQSSLTGSHLSSVDFSKDDVLVALSMLINKKSDSNGISTEHLKHSSSAIAEFLALLFTSILRHGYMPKCFRDCVLVPIQKGSNDATLSQNYRPIAL